LVNHQVLPKKKWKQEGKGLGQSPNPSVDYIGEKRGEGLRQSPSPLIDSIGEMKVEGLVNHQAFL
jgi:hypothetical protein